MKTKEEYLRDVKQRLGMMCFDCGDTRHASCDNSGRAGDHWYSGYVKIFGSTEEFKAITKDEDRS